MPGDRSVARCAAASSSRRLCLVRCRVRLVRRGGRPIRPFQRHVCDLKRHLPKCRLLGRPVDRVQGGLRSIHCDQDWSGHHQAPFRCDAGAVTGPATGRGQQPRRPCSACRCAASSTSGQIQGYSGRRLRRLRSLASRGLGHTFHKSKHESAACGGQRRKSHRWSGIWLGPEPANREVREPMGAPPQPSLLALARASKLEGADPRPTEDVLAMPEFTYTELLPLGEDTTDYQPLASGGITSRQSFGREFLDVDPGVLAALTTRAIADISHLLRPAHLAQLGRILDDPEASPNDRFVALDLLQNACIAAGRVLPMCQDTGTAIVMGKRGQQVLTDGRDEEHISRGVYDAYTELNLRYSQLAPLTMWSERDTGTNLPAQVEIYADSGSAYKFLFMAKGGGSANKSFLYQETKAVLSPQRMLTFLEEKIRSLGTAACPPYHLAIVVGGTSAEYALKTAKYASAHYLDTLPVTGSAAGHGFRDLELRGAGVRADPAARHRRTVRRQVLLPRCPGDPAAQARGVMPGRDRGLVLRRPPGPRQDHARRRVPRAARDRPGAVPARHDVGRARRRRRVDRPEPADTRDPRGSFQVPRQDPAVPVGPARRRQGHCALPRLPNGWTRASPCLRTCAITRCTTPVPRRHPTVSPPGRSGRPRRGAWTPTSSGSRQRAAP